jgi:hypothetical protein
MLAMSTMLPTANQNNQLSKAALQEIFSISEHYSSSGNGILDDRHVMIAVFGLIGQSCAFR